MKILERADGRFDIYSDDEAPKNAIDLSAEDESVLTQYADNKKYRVFWDGAKIDYERRSHYFIEVNPDKSIDGYYNTDAPGRIALTDTECDMMDAEKAGCNAFIYDNGLIPDAARKLANALRIAAEMKKRQAEAAIGVRPGVSDSRLAGTFTKIDAMTDISEVEAFDAAADVRGGP